MDWSSPQQPRPDLEAETAEQPGNISPGPTRGQSSVEEHDGSQVHPHHDDRPLPDLAALADHSLHGHRHSHSRRATAQPSRPGTPPSSTIDWYYCLEDEVEVQRCVYDLLYSLWSDEAASLQCPLGQQHHRQDLLSAVHAYHQVLIDRLQNIQIIS